MPLLDIDPITGAVEHMAYDRSEKKLLITRTLEIDPILDLNQAAYNDSAKPWKKKDLWHIASVPMDQLWVWLQQFNSVRMPADQLRSPFAKNDEWSDFLDLQLNSSDNRKFKTAPVHV